VPLCKARPSRPPVPATSSDRSAVRSQAVAAAHDPLQSLNAKSYYRDQIPAEYKKAGVSFTRQAAY
jgi:hypothetical protein